MFLDPIPGVAHPVAVWRGMTKPGLIEISQSHLDHYSVAVLYVYADRKANLVPAGPAHVVVYAQATGIAVAEVGPGVRDEAAQLAVWSPQSADVHVAFAVGLEGTGGSRKGGGGAAHGGRARPEAPDRAAHAGADERPP